MSQLRNEWRNMEKILDIHKFIETVRNHPCLYDLTSVGYRDQDRKQNVWKSVAAECACSGT